MAGVMRRALSWLWSSRLFWCVVAANAAQAVLRLGFAVAGLDGGMGRFLDGPVPTWTAVAIHVMFLALGVAGVPATLGFATRRRWGACAVALVSVATIAFDAWGCTVQATAALGLVVPTVSLFYMVGGRSEVPGSLSTGS